MLFWTLIAFSLNYRRFAHLMVHFTKDNQMLKLKSSEPHLINDIMGIEEPFIIWFNGDVPAEIFFRNGCASKVAAGQSRSVSQIVCAVNILIWPWKRSPPRKMYISGDFLRRICPSSCVCSPEGSSSFLQMVDLGLAQSVAFGFFSTFGGSFAFFKWDH